MLGQPGLFDLDERYAALSAAGDPLERLAAVSDFELFRAELDYALARSDRTKGGRPPLRCGADVQGAGAADALHALGRSDRVPGPGDRLSFMRFIGVALEDRVPDAKPIWLFREQLTKAGVGAPGVASMTGHRADAQPQGAAIFAPLDCGRIA